MLLVIIDNLHLTKQAVVIINADTRPITCGTAVIYIGQATASIERIGTNACYAVWDGYCGQAAAVKERPFTNRGYTVWNYYAR